MLMNQQYVQRVYDSPHVLVKTPAPGNSLLHRLPPAHVAMRGARRGEPGNEATPRVVTVQCTCVISIALLLTA